MHFRALLTVTLVLSGCGVGKPSQSDLEKILLQQKPQFSLLIEEIEKYRSDNGKYPESIQAFDAAIAESAELPEKFKALRKIPAHYEVARDRSFFRLTYGISNPEDYELHASSSYLSFEKEWRFKRSYVERFPHVEAKYFGTQYQQDHSLKSLELTIASLLEAAKSNSDYPCRNFWGGWVNEALGPGLLQQPPPSDFPVAGEVWLYTADDKKKSYAVVIDRKLFRNTTEPLPFVTGVYKLGDRGKNWILIQQCDSSS